MDKVKRCGICYMEMADGKCPEGCPVDEIGKPYPWVAPSDDEAYEHWRDVING